MDKSPIFAEIVPERSRTSVYALDRSFESLLSSFAPPSVGLLAQHVYGYKPVRQGSTLSEEILTDRKNAASLAKALYTAIGFPMALCCLIYSFLYGAYPRDRERARMEALIETEMQQLESDHLANKRDHILHKVYSSGSEEMYVNDYDGDVIDVDDEDNVLLYRQLTFTNMGE